MTPWSESGIEVLERLPLVTPINRENRRYLATKASRSGHIIDCIDEVPMTEG